MSQIVFYESIKTEKAGTCIPALPKTKLEFTPKLINNNGLGYSFTSPCGVNFTFFSSSPFFNLTA